MSETDFPTNSFDPGPLSWVMGEIREALGRSRTALFEAGGLEPEDQATALRLAKSHLHQAHGALQMVDVEGVAAITQLAEDALDRFKDGSVKCSADHVRAVGRLYGALLEYLEELQGGAPSQPVRLFPYYAALQQVLGAARIHPADLFFPDLAREPVLPPQGEHPDGAVDHAALRQRFERALLPYLKSGDPAQAAPLAEVIGAVAAGQTGQRGRAFWLALQGFAELVTGGHVPGGVYVKQLFGAANLQMRRLAQGMPEYPEAVLRDALFFIAAAEPGHLTPLARTLRAGFALDGMVPPDYAVERYCRLDPEALARATEGLDEARAAWQRLAAGDTAAQPALSQALALVAAASDKLGVTPLAALMRELATLADAAAGAERNAALGQEMATALLFAGHGLDQVRHLPDDFAASAATIAARLQALAAGQEPPPAQWQQGLAQQLQQDDTVAALSQRMKAALRDLERGLDEFNGDSSAAAARPRLALLDGALHELETALAGAGQPDAQAAVAGVRQQVATLAAGTDSDEPAQAGRIAQSVGALGFFADMLAQNAPGARERFAFDAAQGTFRAVPLRKIAGAESIPVLDEEVAPADTPATLAGAGMPAVPAASDGAIEEELLEIFVGEAREVLAFARAELAKPHAEAGTPDSLALLRRSFHTLKGSGRMVGLNQFADAAAAIEKVLGTWLAEARPAGAALFGLLEWAVAELADWVGELVGHGISPRSAAAVVNAAALVLDGQPFAAPDAQARGKTAADKNAVDENAADESAADDSVAAAAPPADDAMRLVGSLAVPAPLFDIYVAEATALAQGLAHGFAAWRQGELDPDALHLAHTLAGTSGTVGFKALRELALALESALQAAPATLDDAAAHELFDRVIGRVQEMLASFAAGTMPPGQAELIATLDAWREALAARAAPVSGAVADVPDELAARLDTLFADTYHALVANPPKLPERDTPVSARPQLATQDESIDDLFDAAFDDVFAAPPLTQAAVPPLPEEMPEAAASEVAAVPLAEPPEPEPDIPAVVDEPDPDLLPVFLEEAADLLPQAGAALRAWQQAPADSAHPATLQRVLHTLKSGARMAGAMRLGQHAHDMETQVESMASPAAAAFEELLAHYDQALVLLEQSQHPLDAAAPDRTAAQTPLIRVRADIVDRLADGAGAVAATHARLAQEVAALRTALAGFDGNPDDVAALHAGLLQAVDRAGADLALQARSTGELQRDLQRVRMAPFASIAERLYRVARQGAKELDKRIDLDIRGDSVEINRAVLERLAGPFEHLLRNAIVHGIEPRTARVAAGKAETGEVIVQASVRGDEIVLELGDDGRGLDLERIRARAIERGLLDSEHADAAAAAQVANLIFEPGFSTADTVTGLAGRGVGMDVVRAEVQALGGRIDVHSIAGQGTRFTLYLPR